MRPKANLHFNHKKDTIPSRTRRKIEYAARTAYTSAACLLLMRFWRWAGAVTYISAILSGTTAVMYLGQWQKNVWKVFYSCVAGGVGGIIVGSAWRFKILHGLLLFIALLWINKCSVWEQLPKVIAGISLALAALWPVLTDGRLSGVSAFTSLFMVVMMPYLITGATLLLPLPKLALPSCQRIIINICDKMTWLLEQHIAAFCHADYADLHMFRVDALSRDINTLLGVLPTLVTYVAAESILLPPLRSFPRRTELFMSVCREMLEELTSMRDIHGDILLQTATHERFSSELRGPLMMMIEECKSVIALVKRRLLDYRADGRSRPAAQTRGEYAVSDLDVDDDALNDIFGRVEDATRTVLVATHRCREKYVFLNKSFADSAAVAATVEVPPVNNSLPSSPCITHTEVQLVDDKYMIDISEHSSARDTDAATHGDLLGDGTSSPIRVRRAWSQASSINWEPQIRIKAEDASALKRKNTLTSDSPRSAAAAVEEGEEELLSENQKELYQENLRYGTKNLNPRGAYLCRLMRCVRLTARFRVVLDEPVSSLSDSVSNRQPRPSVRTWILRGTEGGLSQARTAVVAGAQYLLSCLFEPYRLLRILSCGTKDDLSHEFKSYATAFKIALVGLLLSLLVIDDALREQYPYGIWAMLVVMIVRQENSASSFTSGYQRIEGTVIGCVFAYVFYEAFGCIGDCNYGSVTAGLVIWIACCAYFREGAKHGYAALVAGITPMILLVGRNRNSALAPWARVQMTIVGVGAYLIVDNVVLPRRSDTAVRHLVIDCARNARSQLADSVKALEMLLGYRHIQNDLSKSAPSSDPFGDIELAILTRHSSDSPIELYLRSAALANERFKSGIDRLNSNLELAGNEPELWRRPFPLTEYSSLARALRRVHISGGAVFRALRGLCAALNKMPPEHAAKNFSLLTHISSHIINVSNLADQALQQAEEALVRLYSRNRNVVHTDDDDLTSAVVLNRNSEELLREVDQHFRRYYMSHVCVRVNGEGETTIKRNEEMRQHRQLPGYPEFMVNWQDLFGSTCQHMRDLSQLGNEMQNTRNAESIM